MPEVKWVSSYQIGIHKSEDCEVPVLTLDDLEAWLKGQRNTEAEWGSENYGYNRALDDLLAQLEAHRKEGT